LKAGFFFIVLISYFPAADFVLIYFLPRPLSLFTPLPGTATALFFVFIE
jgi:hypothetical protein